MPLLTLADFVVEQAVALAIGAVAVIAAPKAGPKLVELGGDVGARARSLAGSLPAAPSVATVSAPLTAAGAGIQTGVQRFGKRWGELIDESATLARADVDPASLLAGVSAADVASFAPGRARLRLRQLVGQPQLAEQTATALAAVDGVAEVHARATTGSLLILFDADRYASAQPLLDGIRHCGT